MKKRKVPGHKNGALARTREQTEIKGSVVKKILTWDLWRWLSG